MTETARPPALPPDPPSRPSRSPATGSGQPGRRGQGGLFRAFWRWHFYASFLVAPILLILAVTGLIYLLRFQLEPLMHSDLMRVDVPADAPGVKTASSQLAAAQEAYPRADLTSMREPGAADEPTVFSGVRGDEPLDVYVDPWTGKVLGSLNPDTTVSGYAVRIHADLMSGVWGDRLLELAACWAIVMALTGYYLFLRGRRARSRVPRSLRSWHARIGAVAGAGLLLLLVSGLPWTGVWGGQAQKLATQGGSSLWSQDEGALSDPTSTLDESLPHSHAAPWAQQKSGVPSSDSSGDGSDQTARADVDTAVAVADREGLRHPFTVALPAEGPDEKGVFSVIGHAFDAPSEERTVHVDRFSGRVAGSYGYDEYPALAKVVSQGIGLHEGRSLGWVSFVGSLAMCLTIIAACVTGPTMWWRRRRGGSMDAPRGRMPVRTTPVLAVGLIALGAFLPLFGVSVIVVLLVDQLVLRRVPALSSWFGST